MLRQSEVSLKGWTPQISRDQDYPASGLRERGGEIDAGHRLSFSRQGTGYQESVQLRSSRQELNVGSQTAVILAGGGLRLRECHNFLELFARTGVARNGCQNRNLGDLLEVIPSL